MPKPSPTALSIGLLATGAVVWALATPPLVARAESKFPLNPLGINTSPYGEVFAMAMQSPIDTFWHGVEEEDEHVHDENCTHDHDHSSDPVAPEVAPPSSMTERFRDHLSSLSKSRDLRTNPKPASPAQKFYMRREIENKLRFAYQLDPAHYGNYNTLHFFLTEPSIGTRPELTPSAAKLAQDTINYCLKQENDPRPALTAASACTNILHLMFTDWRSETPHYNTKQMRQCLELLDHCLGRYSVIAKQWDTSKNWDLLSPMRIKECKDRHYFILKIREASAQTILNFEQEPSA